MKTPTFKNIDHSSKAIIGQLTTTYHPETGSSENMEFILTQIYKEICAKEPKININVPETDTPTVNVSIPEPNIVNNVSIDQKAQPVSVTFEVKAHYLLIFINLIMSVIALSIAVYMMGK